jgi:hypothetical protein
MQPGEIEIGGDEMQSIMELGTGSTFEVLPIERVGEPRGAGEHESPPSAVSAPGGGGSASAPEVVGVDGLFQIGRCV